MATAEDLNQFLQPEIRIHVLPGGRLPELGTDGANGFDVFARVIQDDEKRDPKNGNLRLPLWELMSNDPGSYKLKPRESVLVGIGFVLEMPRHVGCLMIARSGQTSKRDRPIHIINSGSLIDSDFRGEAGVRIENRSRKIFEIKPGMKIAQVIFLPTVIPKLVPVASLQELSTTTRGGAALGSTGMQSRHS